MILPKLTSSYFVLRSFVLAANTSHVTPARFEISVPNFHDRFRPREIENPPPFPHPAPRFRPLLPQRQQWRAHPRLRDQQLPPPLPQSGPQLNNLFSSRLSSGKCVRVWINPPPQFGKCIGAWGRQVRGRREGDMMGCRFGAGVVPDFTGIGRAVRQAMS